MADQKEIEDAISSGGAEIRTASGATDWDENELERELEELAKTEEKEKDAMSESETRDRIVSKPSSYSTDEMAATSNMLERLQVLPNVPTESPGTKRNMTEKEQKEKRKTQKEQESKLEKMAILA